MTPDQIDYLLAVLASANVLNKLEETGPEVWEDGLSDIDDADALEAARQLIRTHQWVKIADIRIAARKIRTARLVNFQYEPPALEQDPKYLARLRGQIRAVASGEVPAPTEAPMLTGGPHYDVAERLAEGLAGIGKKIPGEEPIRRPGALGVECPTCRALVGRGCKAPGGLQRKPHAARSVAAGVPGSVAPMDPEQARAEAERRRLASRTLLDQMQDGTP